jgi:hypothetical protein
MTLKIAESPQDCLLRACQDGDYAIAAAAIEVGACPVHRGHAFKYSRKHRSLKFLSSKFAINHGRISALRARIVFSSRSNAIYRNFQPVNRS